jgi:arsenical pump membrane protein
MMLYIGNPTYIVIASAFGIDFNTFTSHMLLPTIVGGVTNALLLYLIFRKDVNRPLNKNAEGKPFKAITDIPGAIIGLLLLSACIVLLSIGPYLGIEMWKISLFFALALLAILIIRDFYASLLRKSKKTVAKVSQRVPWSVVPFVLSLFITVEALRIYGITGQAAVFLSNLFSGVGAASMFYGFASALSANVLNNIPMTVAFVPLIEPHGLVAALATVVGSNIGAEITPLGSLAGIMWLSMLHSRGVEMSFKDFVRYGAAVAPITLLVTLSLLALTFL